MFINLTGHEVKELDSGITIPASKHILRVYTESEDLGTIYGIKASCCDKVYLQSPLPPRKEGIVYIVSALTMNAIPEDRTDFVCPKQVVRNKEGGIIGCRGLRRR